MRDAYVPVVRFVHVVPKRWKLPELSVVRVGERVGIGERIGERLRRNSGSPLPRRRLAHEPLRSPMHGSGL